MTAPLLFEQNQIMIDDKIPLLYQRPNPRLSGPFPDISPTKIPRWLPFLEAVKSSSASVHIPIKKFSMTFGIP